MLFVGSLKGNAIKINKKQFPDIYEILESHSRALELKKLPDMYLLQGDGILNAFALKFVQRAYVVLYSYMLEVAYEEGRDAVSFIIGHELGHIKRNHTGFFKSYFLLPAKFIPFLGKAYSRACEYTCDNIGYNLCHKGALKGALILTAGKRLYTRVNINELISNTKSEQDFTMTFSELFSTHPHLVKRIAAIHQLNCDNFTTDTDTFLSAKVDNQQLETKEHSFESKSVQEDAKTLFEKYSRPNTKQF